MSDAAFTLRLSDSGMRELLVEKKCVVVLQADGKEAIATQTFKALAHCAEAQAAAIKALAWDSSRRKQDKDLGLDAQFPEKSQEAIRRYEQYASKLSEIHQFYQGMFDCLREESARVAAYIIYAKVIRLLNLALLGLEHSNGDVFVLLRPIDEAIDLAKYFSLCSTEEPAVIHVREWFRENRSPKHKIVREMWGKRIDAILGQQGGNSAQLFQQLYFKKSKELHHSYNGMWENHKAGMVDGV